MYKKIFIASGAIVLTTLGAFAGRMSAKKFVPSALYAQPLIGGTCTPVASGITPVSGTFTTGGSNLQQAQITTTGGTAFNLFSTSSCSSVSAVHFQP